MNARPLILLLVVLLAAAGGWLLLAGNDEPLAPTDADLTTPTTDRPDATQASAAGGQGQPADATASPEAPAADPQRDDVEVHEALVPIPDDVEWTEVRIVAKDSRRPIPGAIVRWFDQTTRDAVKAGKLLASPEDVGVDREPQEYAERFGWHTTADSRGIARIHRTQRTVVVARHEQLFGHRDLGANLVAPQSGFELEVAADREVRVQVLTATGKPAVGIPIAVSVRQPKSRFDNLLRWQPLAATRGPDGIAVLRHVQTWHDHLDHYDSYELSVRAFVPSLNTGGTPLDLEQLPQEPLIVRLPPCGTVAVTIQHTPGSTPPETVLLRENTHTGHRGPRPYLSQPIGPDGRATFQHVPIGKQYTAQGRVDGGWISGSFTGPVNAGGHVDYELAPSNDAIRLTGRVLGPDRKPRINTKFVLEVRGQRYDTVRNTTDENGRFVVVLGKAREKNRADRITLHVTLEGERPLLATAAPRELHVGIEDLGDLVLGLDELILGGRCTIDGKPGELPGGVALQYGQPREDGTLRWRNVRPYKLYKTEDGVFEFRGTTEHQRLRLRVSSSDHFPIEPIEFRRGKKDLTLALEAGEALAATMLYSRGDAQLPIVELVDQADAEAEPREGRVFAREDERCQARWPGLPPGTYSLRIRAPGIATPVIRIDDVTVPLPEGGDPRLVDIDLASRVMHQVVRVGDAEGNLIRSSRGGVFPSGQDETSKLIGARLSGREATILLPRGPAELLIAMRGYRPATVSCSGQPIDVQLQPWGNATVTLPQLEPLPEGMSLELRTTPAGSSDRRWKAGWYSGRLRQLVSPYATGAGFENGRAEVPVAATPQDLRLYLRKGRRSWPVKIPEQAVSELTGSMTLSVEQAAIDVAVKGAETKKK
ncbi:MAG: carboxypeptidase-like regulatory domain-containing protein [bacterium]|nr:carboxypeptidase-like regulatory domain-containing protein [bacterium]